MTGDWEGFAFPRVFGEIQRGRRLKKADHTPGDIPYVSSTALDNGVDGFIQEEDGVRIFQDCLSIANSGSVGTVFYEPFRFIASDHVTSLKRKGTSRPLYLFMAASASKQAVNFNFNREITDVRIRKLRLMLPTEASGEPDWAFMEASMRERERRLLDRYLAYARQRLAECEFSMEGNFKLHVGDREWVAFRIDELFEIKPGKRLETRNKEPGDIPFIGASESNNGVTGFVSNVNQSLDSNTLGVNYNGAPCVAFYHPYKCIFSDDVKHLHIINHEDDQYVMLFLVAIFAKQRVKFSYGYKCNEQRMRKQSVMLPVTDDGEPDWAFMDAFMREREVAAVGLYRLHPESHQDGGTPGLNLSGRKWVPFQAFGHGGLFKIKATRSGIDGIRIVQGGDRTVPYITRSDLNNGIAMFVSTDNDMALLDDSGTISVGLDTQTAFYQPSRYLTGQNIHVVSGERLSEGVAHFIVTVLRIQLRSKFNWGGNGATLGRMKRLKIMLPADDDGQPDWDFMERYARAVMAGKYRQYMDYIESADRQGPTGSP